MSCSFWCFLFTPLKLFVKEAILEYSRSTVVRNRDTERTEDVGDK